MSEFDLEEVRPEVARKLYEGNTPVFMVPAKRRADIGDSTSYRKQVDDLAWDSILVDAQNRAITMTGDPSVRWFKSGEDDD